jgi:SAM-dependent methyltransferase
MSDITKALARLQRKDAIHIIKYRKNTRTGLDIPVYSLQRVTQKFDVHPLLAGITSERLVEYDFVARNLSEKEPAMILDIGSGESGLAKAIEAFGKGNLQVFRIDLANVDCEARMDACTLAFRSEVFDQIVCISAIEHFGLNSSGDDGADTRTVEEMARILKNGGTAIISVPYGKGEVKETYRVYDRRALFQLVKPLMIQTKEFYRYDRGKWKKCSQTAADEMRDVPEMPAEFHSAVCACLLLRKRK